MKLSNRTLIEFNHDKWGEIADNEQAFVTAILQMLNHGGTPRTVEDLERYGITYVGQRHHSDRASVTYPHHKVEL